MKKILSITAVIMLMIGFAACKKDAATYTTSTILNASKTTGIKQGEPVILSLSTVSDSSSIVWTVSPATNSKVTPSGSKAIFVFKQKGSYTVNATFKGQTASRSVTVNDSIYTGASDSSNYSSVSLSGDQLILTPSVNDTLNYISISAVTKNSYSCLNNSLEYDLTSGTNAYTISYTGVNVPQGSSCTTGQKTSSALTLLYSPTDGKYTFSVLVNGIMYNGSYNKNGNSYTFTWPYTSGVLFSTLSCSK